LPFTPLIEIIGTNDAAIGDFDVAYYAINGRTLYNRLISGPSSAALGNPGGGAATTRFLYDGAALVAEFNTDNTLLRRYVHGPGIDEPIVWYERNGGGTYDRNWLVADERGSIIARANDAGAVTEVYSYDEYGNPNSWSGSRFRYTGQVMLSEAQLYHYKARAYDPRLGRFLQTDPIGFAGGMNLYAHVGNNPANAIDPWGLQEIQQDEDVVVVTAPRRGGTGNGNGGSGPAATNIGMPVMVSFRSSGGGALPRDICFGGDTCVALQTLAELGVSLAPGGEIALCIINGCTAQQAALAIASVVPILKLARLGGAVVRTIVGACTCFEASTLVMTPDGLVAIEEIQVGDYVLAWNEQTGEVAPQVVTGLIRPEPQPTYALVLEASSGARESFNASADHPWFVVGKGWTHTIDLRAGDRIVRVGGADLVVASLNATGRTVATYNLEVANWHTFLVGEHRAVVHNTCPVGPRFYRGSTRREVMGDNPTCVYCGDRATQVDHVLPWSRGGRTTVDNGVPACASCNASKGPRTPEEWLGQ